MSKASKTPAPVKVVKPSSKAQVIVFDEKSYGISKLKGSSGKGFKQRRSKEDENDIEMEMPTAASTNSKDPDDIADMEVSQLWERLKTTVEDIATSSLTGKARRDHMIAKAARLAGIEVAKPQAPFKHRMGMVAAQKKREKKAKEAAREMDGVVLAGGKKKQNTRGVRHGRR